MYLIPLYLKPAINSCNWFGLYPWVCDSLTEDNTAILNSLRTLSSSNSDPIKEMIDQLCQALTHPYSSEARVSGSSSTSMLKPSTLVTTITHNASQPHGVILD